VLGGDNLILGVKEMGFISAGARTGGYGHASDVVCRRKTTFTVEPGGGFLEQPAAIECMHSISGRNQADQHESRRQRQSDRARHRRRWVMDAADGRIAAIEARLASSEARLAAVEAELRELKARPAVTYEGIYAPIRRYVPGSMVTSAGSIWHCDAATTDKPRSPAWTLSCKKGRNSQGVRDE
jgi:hypothetical protein